MYQPDKETFQRLAEGGTMVPLFRELPADLETPVSALLKLGNTPPCFLLESVERGEQVGRYSFLGANPSLILRAEAEEATVLCHGVMERTPLHPSQPPDPLHLVQRLLAQHSVAKISGLPRFFGGAVGYLSYDTVRFFERLPPCPRDELYLPEAVFLLTETLIIFDHVQHRMKVVSTVPPSNTAYQEAVDKIEAIISALGQPLTLRPHNSVSLSGGKMVGLDSNFTLQEFMHKVNMAKEYILAGDVFQVVISQRWRRNTEAEPFAIYRALRMLNPSPYMFYLNLGDFYLIGSSPEMLVRLEEGKAVTRPIAGTRPRGKSEGEDSAIIASLLADPKERAEHVMLVDLGRNDLGRVCRYGSVRVPVYMTTEKYSHVIHIVSAVEGELKREYDAFSLLRASFPAGTVSGAPKVRAMEIITELEGIRRGPYAGAVGYFGYGGNMDTCITIRTVVMKDGMVYLQGGAGIVADSDPQREYEESRKKTEVLENAVRLAESWQG